MLVLWVIQDSSIVRRATGLSFFEVGSNSLHLFCMKLLSFIVCSPLNFLLAMPLLWDEGISCGGQERMQDLKGLESWRKRNYLETLWKLEEKASE